MFGMLYFVQGAAPAYFQSSQKPYLDRLGIAFGFQETIFVALAMDLAEARIPASMFAIMMALSNLRTAVGEGVATEPADNLSFSNAFWLLAGMNVVTLIVLWHLLRIAPELGLRAKSSKAAAKMVS
jgi:predicted MFS family arabinose efflux permease